MTELATTQPFAQAYLPLTLGDCRIDALPSGPITAVAPYPGRTGEVASRLGGFPAPGEVLTVPAGRLVWAGRETAYLFGADRTALEGLDGLAAVTDQSDAWAGLVLAGGGLHSVLARLVPLDLAGMATPHAARSLLNHLPLLLVRQDEDSADLWTYRSMAGSLLHEVRTAMRAVAARQALDQARPPP